MYTFLCGISGERIRGLSEEFYLRPNWPQLTGVESVSVIMEKISFANFGRAFVGQ